MSELVYLDLETTGLEVGVHQVWEIAYAIGDEDIQSFQVYHDLKNADLNALSINRYLDRVDPHYYCGHGYDPEDRLFGTLCTVDERMLYDFLIGNHLVASNPDFDSRMLAERWGSRPWHHRMIDLAPMGMVHFGWSRPRGIRDIANALRSEGHDIPPPDHSAAGDVATLRACYKALVKDADE